MALLLVPVAVIQSGEVPAFLSHRYLYLPSPPAGVLPVRAAGAVVLQTVWFAVTVFPVISGSTVILNTELSVQTPDVTVRLNQVVAVREPG